MPLTEMRGPRLYLLGLVALSITACFLPLADHVGYELAELVALYAGLFGAAPGVAAARAQRLRQREGRSASGATALIDAQIFALASLLIPLVLILLNGVRRPACAPLANLPLFALLAVPSAALAAAFGVLAGFILERRAGLLVAVAFVGTLALALWSIAFGPQVFAFHHLGGMFPGPIYDEAVHATPALWAFRAATILYTLALSGVALLLGPQPRGPLALVVAGACAAGGLFISARAEQLHFQASVAQIDGELGGLVESPRLALHVPREKTEVERRLLLQQAEADLRAVRTFLGLPPEPAAGAPRIEVFFYRSADEKRRLIGAADTSFTKPWLHQIHTNDEPAPHHILRHELAHAAAADLSHAIFRVPGRWRGLLPDMALIEGLAVAADWPGGELTIDEEARVLLALKLAPDVPRMFKPGLFYAESGARAYTMAGSFVRWLWTAKGANLLARVYAGERMEDVYGPLDALAAEHAQILEQKPASPRALAMGEQRFRSPGIARKTCAHEVADLAKAAATAQAQGEAKKAAALWEKCSSLEPDDPGPLLALRRSALVAGEFPLAQAAQDRALAHPKLSAPQRAQLFLDAGDVLWRAGDADGARARYSEAAKSFASEAQERALQARLAALADRDAWPAARRLLADNDAGPLTWLLLERWAQARPRDGLPAYLLARQLMVRGDWVECAREIAVALARDLPSALFVQESLRIEGLSQWHLGEVAAARRAFEQLSKNATPGRAREAQDWLSRIPTK